MKYIFMSLFLAFALQADNFTDLLAKRYSGREYDAAKPVSKEQLQSILDAGRSAPSSSNEQPWNFLIFDKNSNQPAYEKAFSSLNPGNQRWAQNAPILIFTVASSKTPRGNPSRWAAYDTGAASFAMMLQATSLGLMAHTMGGFNQSKFQQDFAIPADYTPLTVIAIGYPASNSVQPPRERKPLKENFFSNSWGNGFE